MVVAVVISQLVSQLKHTIESRALCQFHLDFVMIVFSFVSFLFIFIFIFIFFISSSYLILSSSNLMKQTVK